MMESGNARPPGSCFWELTRRCELRCSHCRVQPTRPASSTAEELGRAAALRVAEQLIELDCELVVLTGGEPTLVPHWLDIAEQLSRGGVKVRLFTNGICTDAALVEACREAGVSDIALSLDGPREVHDRIRPFVSDRDSSPYEHAIEAARLFLDGGFEVRIVTQLNQINALHLDELKRCVTALGEVRWQIHLIQMTGFAKENRSELLPAPGDLEEVVRVLKELALEARASGHSAIHGPMHCTIGYMVVEEAVLRGRETSGRPLWRGCPAGRASFAITAEGGIKGCVALPDEFITANVMQRSLVETWRDDACFPPTRRWRKEVLEGECAHCAFGEICRAGCPAVAFGATGSVGANPFCLKLVRSSTGSH